MGAMLVTVYNQSFDRPSCNLVLINLTTWSVKADVNMAKFLNNNEAKGIILAFHLIFNNLTTGNKWDGFY